MGRAPSTEYRANWTTGATKKGKDESGLKARYHQRERSANKMGQGGSNLWEEGY